MYSKQTVEVEGSAMDVLVFRPEGDGPFPGMVVAQHFPIAHEGLEKDPFTIDIGDRLAAAGIAAVIPYMFHWWPPELDRAEKRELWRDDHAVADLGAAYDVLTGIDGIDKGRTGIMGHCWGGRMSWLGACHNPDFKACIVLYGGRVKLPLGPPEVAPITLADRIPCPVLGIFGNEDRNPSPEDVDDMDAALTAAGIPHSFHRYDGAGHGFQDFMDDDRYRKEQAEDAWTKVLGFLKKELKV